MSNLFDFDKDLLQKYDYIIGTDEAGRGPGAGPVFAAAVCFKNMNEDLLNKLAKVNDSKQLTEKSREELYDIITQNCIYSIHQGSVEDIEKMNILNTSLLMMKKSCCEIISQLDSDKIQVLVDGNRKIKEFQYPQETIVKGDAKSFCIAAASILAKVARDRVMKNLDAEFPMYEWAKNKGYMTKVHLDAVDKYGLTKWHRKKFFEKHLAKQNSLI